MSKIKKQVYPDKPEKAKPFHGVANTDYHLDVGGPHDITEQRFDRNTSVFGVKSRPKEFQPFFRYQGSECGATFGTNMKSVISEGSNQGQPKTLAYRMEKQGVELGRIEHTSQRPIKVRG